MDCPYHMVVAFLFTFVLGLLIGGAVSMLACIYPLETE